MARQRGFSLIEALVTLVVVLVGLTGAARLQAGLLAASAQAKAQDEATALALDKLSEFQSVRDYAAYRDAIVPGSARHTGLLHTYQLEWTVAHNPAPDFKQVDILVRWPADDPDHSLRIQTLIPGHDPARFAHLQLAP
jgi:type IV pilus assembly protein PilV